MDDEDGEREEILDADDVLAEAVDNLAVDPPELTETAPLDETETTEDQDEEKVEIIFWTPDASPNGSYKIALVYFFISSFILNFSWASQWQCLLVG